MRLDVSDHTRQTIPLDFPSDLVSLDYGDFDKEGNEDLY
jgi:hypothetical protein